MTRKLWTLAACATALTAAALCTPLISTAPAQAPPRTPRYHVVIQRSRARDQTTLPRRLARIRSLPRIIGGNDAAQGEWPFMAFILYIDANGNPVFNCSGTVVAPNVILTAAHCTLVDTTGASLDPAGFGVVTGSLDWSNPAERQLSLVSRIIKDPLFNPVSGTNDAALLVLATPTTAPATALATSADGYLEQAGTPAFIAGWGATYDGEPLPPTYLQWADTVVQRAIYCRVRDPYFSATLQLCAVDPPQDSTGTCNGDSGGPVSAFDASGQFVEIGLTSRGPTDCNTYTADYFTAIAPLYPWISGWIQAVAPSSPPPPTSSPPTMALTAAKQYVRQTLAGAIPSRFTPAHSYTAKCVRKSSVRFKCTVGWWHGPNDYYGTVTVYYYTDSTGTTYWTDSYTVYWVNDYCYFHSGHPTQCRISTRHGTY
jgi:Trypsin